MPTGFQSITDSGIVQIDENYSALSLISAPTVFINDTVTYYDVLGANPIVFMGDTNGSYIVGVSRQSIGSNLWRFGFVANSSTNVKFYFFDRGPVIAGTTGMQVFDSSGALVYDSNNVVLTLIAVHQVTGGDPNSFSPPINGRIHAAALSFSRSWVEERPISHSAWRVYEEGMRVSSTQFTTGWVQTYLVGGEDPGNWRRDPDASAPPQILVIDATGA